jgi:hypothetical protein
VKNSAKIKLDEFSTPTNIKLALLWASLMFLYIYNDYFSMYTHGTIDDMAKGRLGQLRSVAGLTNLVETGHWVCVKLPQCLALL